MSICCTRIFLLGVIENAIGINRLKFLKLSCGVTGNNLMHHFLLLIKDTTSLRYFIVALEDIHSKAHGVSRTQPWCFCCHGLYSQPSRSGTIFMALNLYTLSILVYESLDHDLIIIQPFVCTNYKLLFSLLYTQTKFFSLLCKDLF